jgi:uncharacterized protein YchJ
MTRTIVWADSTATSRPGGSGKKFKKCCGGHDYTDAN